MYPRTVHFIDKIFFYFLIGAVIATPLILDSHAANPFIIPKQFFIFAIVIVGVLVYLLRALLAKELLYTRSSVDWLIIIFLLVSIASGIFSIARRDSFFGRTDFFFLSITFIIALITFFFLVRHGVTSLKRWQLVVDTLMLAGSVSALIFIAKTVFHIDILKNFVGATNPVDIVNNNFGMWLAVTAVLALGQLMKKGIGVWRLLGCVLGGILMFVSIALLNLQVVWLAFLIGALLLATFGVVRGADIEQKGLLAPGMVVLFVCLFFIFNLFKFLPVSVANQTILPVRQAWEITENTLRSGVKNAVLGSGPGTFIINFSRFRNPELNTDPTLWALRFNRPTNSLLALVNEGGLLTLLSFVVLIGTTVFYAIKKKRLTMSPDTITLNDVPPEPINRLTVFVVGISWVMLTLSSALIFFGPVLWWLWWTLFALLIIDLEDTYTVPMEKLVVENNQRARIIFVVVGLVAVLLVAGAAIGVGRWYLAEVKYANALRATYYEEAQRNAEQAIRLRGTADMYHLTYAETYLMEAAIRVREQNPDTAKVIAIIDKAVQAATRATELSPHLVVTWENLATFYENAGLLVPEARDWAIKTLVTATQLEPTNPILYWRLGNNFSGLDKWTEAIGAYTQAMQLKPDYIDVHLALANVYERSGQPNQALETYQTALTVQNTHPYVLYNYGRLLYNRNHKEDRKTAERLWLRSIELEPQFANALYSLGMLYEARGEAAAALQYYYKVKELNPDNTDLLQRINAVVSSSSTIQNK